MIVIHHTDTPKNFTVTQIAQYHVYGERKDTDGNLIKGPWPGIGYHFVIAANGTIYRCQDALDTLLSRWGRGQRRRDRRRAHRAVHAARL